MLWGWWCLDPALCRAVCVGWAGWAVRKSGTNVPTWGCWVRETSCGFLGHGAGLDETEPWGSEGASAELRKPGVSCSPSAHCEKGPSLPSASAAALVLFTNTNHCAVCLSASSAEAADASVSAPQLLLLLSEMNTACFPSRPFPNIRGHVPLPELCFRAVTVLDSGCGFPASSLGPQAEGESCPDKLV